MKIYNLSAAVKTNPIKPNSKPIKANFKAKQTQSNPISERPKWIWGIVIRGRKKVKRQESGGVVFWGHGFEKVECSPVCGIMASVEKQRGLEKK